MSNLVVYRGFGLSVGVSSDIPEEWKGWEGYRKGMTLPGFFDKFPGYPEVEVCFGGSVFNDDMWVVFFIKETVHGVFDGKPVLFPREDVKLEWANRLTNISKALGLNPNDTELGWLAVANIG